jgi:signal transduction histidine kinase
MKRWEERARKEVRSSAGTTSLALQDALAGHLIQLAAALDASKLKSTDEIAFITLRGLAIGKKHGRERAYASHYSIEELIFEYRIFRQVIIQVLEEDEPLSSVEHEIITDLIEQAVNDAAGQFSDSVRDMKDEYNSILTHDLRSPLTALKGFAKLIIMKSGDPEFCVSSAKRIIESVNRMDGLIQNLLDAGQIRGGQGLPMKPVECDPVVIVNQVLHEMKTLYGDRFSFSPLKGLRTWWDYGLILRALENLLGNAIKYGDPKALITVRLKQFDKYVTLTVHNEGNPISEQDQVSLFERYRRLDSAVKGEQKGWGLGLLLTSGVAKAHGGRVDVESTQSQGTSFILTLLKDCRSEGVEQRVVRT